MNITTKLGTVTENWQDFGYGSVWHSNGVINYRDCTDWKQFKTVKGFERFAERNGYSFK